MLAYQEAKATGCGSLAIEGKMVDAASIRIAEAVYKQWKIITERK
jgi:citrate lyase beta subunit